MSKQNKFFFLLFSLKLGGVEKSFLNLISDTKFKDTEIHLGLLKKEGEYMTELPSQIIIHECCKGLWNDINKPIHQLIIESLKNYNIKKAFQLSIVYLKYKISGNRLYYYKYVLKDEPVINIKFDEAYAYAGPASIIDYYIIHKIKAEKKFGFIHFDVSKFFVESQIIKKLYKNYQNIYVVSEEAKNIFNKKFPEFKDKTQVKLTPINFKEICKLSDNGESYSDKFKGIRILTVGRISKEKGQDLAIESLKILIDKGFNVKWYFIGEGNFLTECKMLAKELGIENNIQFLGKKLNPYPYMKDCDIYVQPSRHEGFCLTLAEALYFDNPIIVTNFAGAAEQLKNYQHSFITAMAANRISDKIMVFLQNENSKRI